ncbi:cinnamoyl-CoA reductase 2-like [Dorcoceras hygrometricum]|uniref:Cinnamoyl-CoA reductase 2-like n=1 Tax=Dorcoceras hygrometricum TaxID=472368 RepID=A0A2Z7ASS7_9LAMI|nr:cinnamoyl-CoA reductase 2-like [Dorcoceras hygrometricum]
MSHGSWFSPENTTRPPSSRPRVSPSTVEVQRHEDRDFLQNYGYHLGSRRQSYILLYFNSSSRTCGGDTPDAPYYHLGTRESNSSPKTPTHTSSSGVTRGPSDTLHSTYATELGLFPEDVLSRSGVARGLTTSSGIFPKDHALT